jgi:hypothetical protein
VTKKRHRFLSTGRASALSFLLGDTLKRYAVMIDIDGDLMFVSNNNPFTSNDNDPKTFDTLEEAAQEADEWNTGMVVELSYDKSNLH